MKVLIIGSDYNWSIERIYKRELNKLGHEIIHVPVQNWHYDFYYKSTLHKVLVRLGISKLENRIQKRLIHELEGQFFDLIWVFKGMELTPHTLKTLKNQTTRLINFNPDNPFIFSGKGSGNKNITRSIHLYDEHFTYDHEVKSRIESEFGIKCTLVPFGFDNEVISTEELNEVGEIKAVCFVGNPDAYRTKILQDILNQGLPLHVYGHDWQQYLSHPNLTIHGAVYEKEYYKTLRKYRVQLNIMRVHNLVSHNMRSIEVPGCGGIMLAPRTKDHEAFFEEGKEAFFFVDVKELVVQAQKLLELDDINANSLRMKASSRVEKNYLYITLTQTFLG
ncbi:MAG: glycosyltransferase [Sphingomonadales bacterium]|nr:glycosyltransferase [Sphingomonadales bacterium]